MTSIPRILTGKGTIFYRGISIMTEEEVQKFLRQCQTKKIRLTVWPEDWAFIPNGDYRPSYGNSNWQIKGTMIWNYTSDSDRHVQLFNGFDDFIDGTEIMRWELCPGYRLNNASPVKSGENLDLYCMFKGPGHTHVTRNMPVSGDAYMYCLECKKEVKS